MSSFSKIDLSSLPPPQSIDPSTVDDIYADITAKFISDYPEYAEVLDLESDPIPAQLQALAYRDHLYRQFRNAAVKADMLAFATGSDLDNLVAIVPLLREDGESDGDLRKRAQLAPEGCSVAGPVGAYVFHAKKADPSITDVHVTSPSAGAVDVYVLTEAGITSEGVIESVENTLSPVRPLTDLLTVLSAVPVPFDVTAELSTEDGPGSSVVIAAAQASVEAYLASRRAFGKSVYISAIKAALHVAGVEAVTLSQPVADIIPEVNEAALVGTIAVTVAPDV